jgi:predicted acylesterase/phospholipase RssA
LLRLFADPNHIEQWLDFGTQAIRSLTPWLWSGIREADWEERKRLVSDCLQLVWASLSPGELKPSSLGVCANAPFIDQIVDFDKLKNFPGEFNISACNIHRRQMENWGKNEIDKDHFLAALSFPLIYAPYEINRVPYYEGASVDGLNFAFLVNDDANGNPEGRHTKIDTSGWSSTCWETTG